MPNAFIFFFRCLLLSFFRYRREKIVIDELFNKFTYRYTEVELKSYLSPLRYLKSSLLLIWRNNLNSNKSKAESYTYDLLTHFLEGDRDYLNAIGKVEMEFVFRDNLYNDSGIFQKLANTMLLFSVFGLILPLSIFRTDKAKLSLILQELVETHLLAKFLGKSRCRELLIISAFEKDIMFLSYYLSVYYKIRVSLLPSANPISTLYKNVICDTFIFTAPYQKEEYEDLKNNWVINNTAVWPPYGFNSIKLNRFGKKNNEHTIGILSSGMALREYLKHPSEYAKNDFKAETALLEAVKKLIDEGIVDKPIVYLHPLEKSRKEYQDFSTKYYKAMFGETIDFAPCNKPSKAFFDLCSIGISVYSSSQTERMFGGYKTLFAPMGYLKNFFPGNTFSNISAQSYEDLKNLVVKLTTISDDDFFEFYKLKEYRWDAFIRQPLPQNTIAK